MIYWRPRKWRIAGGAMLVLLSVAAHLPGLDAGFIIDDASHLTENECLRGVESLRRLWFDFSCSPQYYPLTFTSFWLEYQVWGLNPLGYHAGNIALHGFNVVLLWGLLSMMAVPGAWLAAAVFAVHPVHVESVAWVAERKNVLSGFFYLAAAILFLRFQYQSESKESPGSTRWLLLGSVGLFTLAMLSKTAVVTLPVALILAVWWKQGRVTQRDWLVVSPMLVIGFGLSLVTIWFEMTRGGASGELWSHSWLDRVVLAARAVWFYAGKLAWPAGLSFNYERWSISSGLGWSYFYVVALAAVLWMLWGLRHKVGRGPCVAVLYFIVTLGPTLGFFNVYFFRYSFVADHFQYLASIGLISLGAAGFVGWAFAGSTGRKAVGAVLACSALIVLAILTWNRSWIFRDLETLCLDVKSKNPESWLATNNLGNLYLERGELSQAVSELEAARSIAPRYIETHLNLAIAYMNQNRLDEAIDSARLAIALKPENKFGYKHLADATLRSGRAEDSIPWFEAALSRDPEYIEASAGLASALAQAGDFALAIEVASRVLQHDPDSLVARTSLAISLAESGRYEESIREFERALRLDPDNRDLRQNLQLVKMLASTAPTAAPQNPNSAIPNE